MSIRKNVAFFLWSCTGLLALAAPQITEFVAINGASLTDGDGNPSDWIEIHNPDVGVLDLSGYLLSDDPALPAKYSFPAGTSIAAGQYLVVFASGRVEDHYTDAAGNLHTNFSLSGNGEYLSLRNPDGSLIQELAPEYPSQSEDISYGIGISTPVVDIVTSGTAATWFSPGSDIGNSWQTPSFDDATWTSCETAIGYGTSYTSLIGSGGNTSTAMWFGNPSVYLRIPFELSSPLSSLTLNMRYEDGFVAYLNGVRVASANAPDEASLTHTSTATAVHPNAEALVAESFPLSTASLVTGK
ncbi:lamin tail domain-containing protein [Akkermansiaceae bacterium]|nr:lamin tail domain-containing protein [Akkermansiaceae bacterium]